MDRKEKHDLKKVCRSLACLMLAVILLAVIAGCSKGQTASHESDLALLLEETGNMLISENPEPVFGAVGGEWLIFGISHADIDVPDGWYDQYYKNVEACVKACDGILDERKHTEYSRVIIALNAIGKDPADVAGYDLLQPLADFEQTIFQGVNGPAYALLALDSGNYKIPKLKIGETQATREMYVDYILSEELEGGGWSLAGGPADADITTIALQALAKYRDRDDVEAAIQRGLQVLSELQSDQGGYASYDTESSETVSQVIVALMELGIPMEDERFVKNGNTLMDKLLEFRTEDGGFRHLLDGETDMLATEQAFYALLSLHSIQQGQSSIYGAQ